MTNEQRDRQIEITIAQQVFGWKWVYYPEPNTGGASRQLYLESPATVETLKEEAESEGWEIKVFDRVEDTPKGAAAYTGQVPHYLSSADDDVEVLHRTNGTKDGVFRQHCRWKLAKLWFERKTGQPYHGNVVDLSPYSDPMQYLPGDYARAIYAQLEEERDLKTTVASGAAS